MNRIIKFKAWHNKYKLMSFAFEPFKEASFEILFNGKTFKEVTYPDKNIVFRQFIGLKDKYGKEIYEGDILEDSLSKRRSEVRWDFRSLEGLSYYLNRSEIVGNIYQNPEWLK